MASATKKNINNSSSKCECDRSCNVFLLAFNSQYHFCVDFGITVYTHSLASFRGSAFHSDYSVDFHKVSGQALLPTVASRLPSLITVILNGYVSVVIRNRPNLTTSLCVLIFR